MRSYLCLFAYSGVERRVWR